MDLLPTIIEAARSRREVRVQTNRPGRLAKELRRHLPHHQITIDEGARTVTLRQVEDPRCSVGGPVCTPAGATTTTKEPVR